MGIFIHSSIDAEKTVMLRWLLHNIREHRWGKDPNSVQTKHGFVFGHISQVASPILNEVVGFDENVPVVSRCVIQQPVLLQLRIVSL